MINELSSVGLSEYEAKAYISLLENHPATAYELAKASGIPTSKIYEVISRLYEKGIVSELGEEGTRKYIPMDSDEFIESYRTRMETTLKTLKEELSTVGKGADVSYIWNISDYDYLMDKAERMILESQDTLLISAWRDEMSLLDDFLKMAEIRGVKITIIHFGKPMVKTGRIFHHPIEDTIYTEKGGRGIVIVADSKEVLMGTILKDKAVQGAWSLNRGFVMLAEDYIKHDVYIMKIVWRFDRELRKMFGNKYEHLRDIFSDEEIS